jgi:hypothetical protein
MQIRIRLVLTLSLLPVVATLALSGTLARAQNSGAPGMPQPVTFTSDQDHQNMMSQLGIKALRPGPSGDEKAPNHANYDESKANPYPNLPDVLSLNDGKKVTTSEMWWKQRRAGDSGGL